MAVPLECANKLLDLMRFQLSDGLHETALAAAAGISLRFSLQCSKARNHAFGGMNPWPMQPDVVITAAARTAVGAFNGAFASLPAHVLGQSR